MAGGVAGKHGITSETPKNILFGAGTIHKNLTYSDGWQGEIIGSTNGGSSLEIINEIKPLEVDGAKVNIKGMATISKSKAKMEVNFAELSTDILKMATLGETGSAGSASNYDMIQMKPTIKEGDYIQNFGFVGKTANDQKDIVVIFENALCTSGLKIDPKDNDQAVIKLEMEAYAENSGNLDTLPVKIYYPKNVIL